MGKIFIILSILLTGCSTTQTELIPCQEIEMQARHMDFILDSCVQQVYEKCEETESDCAQAHVLRCYEDHFGLKETQAKDYRLQKCWKRHYITE